MMLKKVVSVLFLVSQTVDTISESCDKYKREIWQWIGESTTTEMTPQNGYDYDEGIYTTKFLGRKIFIIAPENGYFITRYVSKCEK